MKQHRILLRSTTVVLVLLLALLVAVGASAGHSPFIGKWESTDIDGSAQTLTIGGGPGMSHRVRYHDSAATVCGLGPDGEILHAARAIGRLTASGNTLSGAMDVYCMTRPPSLWQADFPFTFVYDPATDTLSDGFVTWTRK